MAPKTITTPTPFGDTAMPFSAARTALRKTVVTVAATIALLGIADAAANGSHARSIMSAVQICGNCGGGF